MKEYNWMHIWGLLQVVREVQGHPSLKNIGVAAMAELQLIANPPAESQEVEVDNDTSKDEAKQQEPPLGDAPNERRV